MAIQETSAVSSAAVNGKHGHSLISDQKFHQLYTLALDFHLAGERGLASLAGREAALAGVSADLLAGDLLVMEQVRALTDSTGMGISAVEQARPETIYAMGDRIIHALSAALSNHIQCNRQVTVLFFPEEQDGRLLAEARAVANRARLPVIFVEEGSEHATPPGRAKSQRKSGVDELISIPVDAHDVIAAYRVAHESIARARQGGGPTRIVCITLPAVGGSHSQTCGNGAVAKLEGWLKARGLPVQEWRREIVARRDSRNSLEWQESSSRGSIPQSAA